MKHLKKKKVDAKLLTIIILLLSIGLVTYISTSLSIYTEDKELFWSLMIRHVGLGVIGGSIAMYITSHIDYRHLKKYAVYIFGLSVLATALVFIPGLGFSHGGATRWLSLGFITLQPAEFLKLGTILFFSAWLAKHKKEIGSLKFGLLPFLGIVGIAFATLIPQPDTGTIALIGIVCFLLYFIRGASWKHIGVVALCFVLFAGLYTAMNPHVIDRIKTFADPNRDPYGASYQVQQSKIAIGSGKLYGRGLGQSVHKFGPYLPESNSDSIFAVFAEEFGFIGTSVLVTLYTLLAFFGVRIARLAPTNFGQNITIGIIFLIVIQVFFNIAAISGLVPLSGLPLIFMSHGGSALFISLAQLGIILNVSRYIKVPRRRVK